MAQERLTKGLMADIIHECRKNNVYLANDVLDVLDHMAYANATAEVALPHVVWAPDTKDVVRQEGTPRDAVSEKKLDGLDKPVVEDSTKQTYKRVCKQCGREFEGTKKAQLCPECKTANMKKSRQNWEKAHASVKKEDEKKADDNGVGQTVKDILALAD